TTYGGQLYICQDINLGGYCRYYDITAPDLGGNITYVTWDMTGDCMYTGLFGICDRNWNDEISSYNVDGLPDGATIQFYEHTYAGGRVLDEHTVKCGAYDPKLGRVITCVNGREVRYTNRWVGPDVNDRISSIGVRRLPCNDEQTPTYTCAQQFQ